MFCEKCGNEIKNNEKYCGKCGKKTETKSKLKLNVILFLIIIFIIIIWIINNLMTVEIPNLVGMSVAEAQETMNKLGIGSSLKVTNCGSEIEIIQKQQGATGTVKKNGYFNVYVWTKEYYEEQELKKKAQENVKNIIENFANTMRTYNGGSIKYSNYQEYSTTDNNETVYKIKYNTSYNYMYYYQLVSLNHNAIDKKTRLFLFTGSNSSSETGEKLELEYAYEELWEK